MPPEELGCAEGTPLPPPSVDLALEACEAWDVEGPGDPDGLPVPLRPPPLPLLLLVLLVDVAAAAAVGADPVDGAVLAPEALLGMVPPLGGAYVLLLVPALGPVALLATGAACDAAPLLPLPLLLAMLLLAPPLLLLELPPLLLLLAPLLLTVVASVSAYGAAALLTSGSRFALALKPCCAIDWAAAMPAIIGPTPPITSARSFSISTYACHAAVVYVSCLTQAFLCLSASHWLEQSRSLKSRVGKQVLPNAHGWPTQLHATATPGKTLPR